MLEDKLLPDFYHGFFWSEENVYLNYFPTLNSVSVLLCPNFISSIKEALYIRANNPSLNRNVGKFHLPHIWDEVLLNISELKLK